MKQLLLSETERLLTKLSSLELNQDFTIICSSYLNLQIKLIFVVPEFNHGTPSMKSKFQIWQNESWKESNNNSFLPEDLMETLFFGPAKYKILVAHEWTKNILSYLWWPCFPVYTQLIRIWTGWRQFPQCSISFNGDCGPSSSVYNEKDFSLLGNLFSI